MWVIKTDGQGNPVLDTAGKPVMIEIPDSFSEANGGQNGTKFLTADEAERIAADREKAAAAKASADEKRKVRKELDDANAGRADLEARMAARDKAEKDNQLRSLPPDQQVVSRLNEVETELARERALRVETETRTNHQIRQVGLVAYRERALRDVPEDVHSFVGGSDETEIDQSVDNARRAYENVSSKIRSDLEAQFNASRGGAAGNVPQQQQQPYYPQPVAPPQNPAYVPPVPVNYGVQAGFPTMTNPPQVPEQIDAGQNDISEMTSEQAVRSGRYGGEMRERIHGALKGNLRYPGSLGSTPRHWNAAQQPNHTPMPGGVMQPQGTQMGPSQPPGMPYQQPQPYPQQQGAPPQGPPQNGHRAQAAEAIARMHQGGNPIVQGDSAANTALNAAHQHAQQRGIPSSQAAFGQRFTHTPPISQNGQS